MRVGSFLAGRIDARTGVLVEACSLADAAVGLDRERGYIPTAVVGHEEHLPGLINHQVTRSASPGIDLIDKSEGAGFAIDGVAADRAVFLVVACFGFLTH